MESKVYYIEKLGVFGCTVFGGDLRKANFFFFLKVERTNLVINFYTMTAFVCQLLGFLLGVGVRVFTTVISSQAKIS